MWWLFFLEETGCKGRECCNTRAGKHSRRHTTHRHTSQHRTGSRNKRDGGEQKHTGTFALSKQCPQRLLKSKPYLIDVLGRERSSAEAELNTGLAARSSYRTPPCPAQTFGLSTAAHMGLC